MKVKLLFFTALTLFVNSEILSKACGPQKGPIKDECRRLEKEVVGFAEMQGRRPTMEDAHYVEIKNNKGYSFFGLYDGHGGRKVADFAAQNLHKYLQKSVAKNSFQTSLKNSFLETNKALDDAAINSYVQGCTAIVSIIVDKQLFVANAGDSRAILSRSGKAIALSEDHKPDRPDEKRRIEGLGGRVIMHGVPRVNGDLAISRSLGDKRLHPFVIAIPEIFQETLTPADEFLIMACDGVWDVIENQAAVDIVLQALNRSPNDFDNAARTLRDTAFQRGSTDNISVIIINLKKLS